MQINAIIYRIGFKKWLTKWCLLFFYLGSEFCFMHKFHWLWCYLRCWLLITDMMVICGINENENIRLGRLVMVQFVTPHFHPNLIGNVFSMSKCLHSYTLLTWFHQNKYPFKINALNASQCDIFVQWCHDSDKFLTYDLFYFENLSLLWHHWETNIHIP